LSIYGNWGGLVDNNLEDLSGLDEDGVIGFKAFMSNSGVDFARVDDDLLYAGLKFAGQVGNLIGTHAENEYVTRFLGQEMRAAGRTDRASWYESRPPESELEAIQRACYWQDLPVATAHRAYHRRRWDEGCGGGEGSGRPCDLRDMSPLPVF